MVRVPLRSLPFFVSVVVVLSPLHRLKVPAPPRAVLPRRPVAGGVLPPGSNAVRALQAEEREDEVNAPVVVSDCGFQDRGSLHRAEEDRAGIRRGRVRLLGPHSAVPWAAGAVGLDGVAGGRGGLKGGEGQGQEEGDDAGEVRTKMGERRDLRERAYRRAVRPSDRARRDATRCDTILLCTTLVPYP